MHAAINVLNILQRNQLFVNV